MAIPRFAGFGYGAAATRALQSQALGGLAGMNLPEFSLSHEGVPLHQPSGVRGAPATHYYGMANPTSARTGTIGNFPGSRAAPRGPINALAYQGQATAVNAARPLPAQALAQGRQARSELWNQAKGAVAGALTPAPSTFGFRSLSQPAPPPQLALPQTAGGPRIAGPAPAPGASEPMSRSGLGTWPTVEKPAAPLNPLDILTGNWGTQPERPPTRVTPYSAVGAAVPSSRPPEARTDPFAAAQGGLPATPEEPEAPGLPPTAAPRSRRVSFNPNQGTLPGI